MVSGGQPTFNYDRFAGLVGVVGLHFLDFADYAFPGENLAKYNVLLIQVRCRDSCDEELTTVGSFFPLLAISAKETNQVSRIPGPALAIDNKKGLSCLFMKFSSSNFVP